MYECNYRQSYQSMEVEMTATTTSQSRDLVLEMSAGKRIGLAVALSVLSGLVSGIPTLQPVAPDVGGSSAVLDRSTPLHAAPLVSFGANNCLWPLAVAFLVPHIWHSRCSLLLQAHGLADCSVHIFYQH